MSEYMALSQLKVGDTLVVRSVKVRDEGMRQRLCDIGVVENTKIRCVMVSPLGDPKAYSIRGAIIAVRYEDADGILGERVRCSYDNTP